MTDERWGDDEIDALLAAARDVPPAPAAARARVADRLAATIAPPPSAPPPGAGEGMVSAGSGAAASGGAGGALLSTGGWGVVVGLTLAVGIGIGWLRPGIDAAPPAQPPPTERSASTTPADRAPARSDGTRTIEGEAVEGEAVEGEAGEDGSAVDRTPTAERAPTVDRALAAERALLQAAREALVARRLDPALAALAAHEARFSGGRLVEEREVLWIRALLAAERVEDATARAKAFAAGHPDSVFRPAVEALIRR